MEKVQGVKSVAGNRTCLTEEECSRCRDAEERLTAVKGNEVATVFASQSQNEGLARMIAAAFVSRLNPTIEELADIKTAVSEAVTNAIIHGYPGLEGRIWFCLSEKEREVTIEVLDRGVGMPDILQAMEPMYTTRPELERSGMGFALMEAFMDEVEIQTAPGFGTYICMKKKIAALQPADDVH